MPKSTLKIPAKKRGHLTTAILIFFITAFRKMNLLYIIRFAKNGDNPLVFFRVF
jgi:hypothetical protein